MHATVTATITKTYSKAKAIEGSTKKGSENVTTTLLEAGTKVIVHTVQLKHVVVEYKGQWYRVPRRLVSGIPHYARVEK